MRLLNLLTLVTGAFSHRVRAALTLLGVTIGTASIVLLASLLHGGEGALITSDQEASDEDIVEVHAEDPRARSSTGPRARSHAPTPPPSRAPSQERRARWCSPRARSTTGPTAPARRSASRS